MDKNPSHFSPMGAGKDKVAGMDTTRHPVEMVSWNDAAWFCAKLSEKEQLKPFYFGSQSGETVTPLDGTGYRLPTEAEWEFACRAGTTTKYWIGDKDQDLPFAAWFRGNAGGRTHAVGELNRNPFGLYDILGNVWEWVQDWWEPGYYARFQDECAVNPIGPSTAFSQRVFRVGSWANVAVENRASSRHGADPAYRQFAVGFRVALLVDAVRQALPQPPKAEAGPERSAAEWALSIGAKIHINENGNERPIGDVGQLPQQAFELTGVNFSKCMSLNDAELARYEACKNLKYLVLDNTSVTDAGLAHFKNCTKLTILGVGGTIVSNAGLTHLKECRNLGGLWLYSTRVNDAGLAGTIRELPNLATLHLAYSRVSDAGLAHLKDYRNLRTLVLSGCQVSDAGLEYLADCPKLLSVAVENTQVTDAGVKKLSIALPRCIIRWDGGESGPK
jgi:hypothetical protein